jgi:hypothetical protein
LKVRFGECAFDSAARRLERSGRPVELTPKAFALLELLIGKRPRAVSKAEIRDTLWPDTFVSEVNLASLAFEVRQAIGDDARKPRHVRTVRGYGYAFELEGDAAAPVSLYLIWRDRQFALGPGVHDVGRSQDVAVMLGAGKVSRRHARIRIEGVSAVLEDLGSKNGTYLRGERLTEPAALTEGDEIRLGTETLLVRFAAPDSPTETID